MNFIYVAHASHLIPKHFHKKCTRMSHSKPFKSKWGCRILTGCNNIETLQVTTDSLGLKLVSIGHLILTATRTTQINKLLGFKILIFFQRCYALCRFISVKVLGFPSARFQGPLDEIKSLIPDLSLQHVICTFLKL